jgi:hypothetical protein
VILCTLKTRLCCNGAIRPTKRGGGGTITVRMHSLMIEPSLAALITSGSPVHVSKISTRRPPSELGQFEWRALSVTAGSRKAVGESGRARCSASDRLAARGTLNEMCLKMCGTAVRVCVLYQLVCLPSLPWTCCGLSYPYISLRRHERRQPHSRLGRSWQR